MSFPDSNYIQNQTEINEKQKWKGYMTPHDAYIM